MTKFICPGRDGPVFRHDLQYTVCTSVRTIQGKVDRSNPVLIILCSSVVQYQSSTAHAESAERPVC